MDGIKFVGTKTTDLKKCLAFILEQEEKELITHIDVSDNNINIYCLADKNGKISDYFNCKKYNEKGLLPLPINKEATIEILTNWRENKPNPPSYGDGTTVKAFHLLAGDSEYNWGEYDSGTEKFELENISKLVLCNTSVYHGK